MENSAEMRRVSEAGVGGKLSMSGFGKISWRSSKFTAVPGISMTSSADHQK